MRGLRSAHAPDGCLCSCWDIDAASASRSRKLSNRPIVQLSIRRVAPGGTATQRSDGARINGCLPRTLIDTPTRALLCS